MKYTINRLSRRAKEEGFEGMFALYEMNIQGQVTGCVGASDDVDELLKLEAKLVVELAAEAAEEMRINKIIKEANKKLKTGNQ